MTRLTTALLAAFVGTVGLADSLPGNNLKLTAENLTFTYQPHEAAGSDCRHKLVDPAAQDWEVECDGGKKYRVHLWVTAYPHTSPPKLSYEVLYWVTDHKAAAGTGNHGATVWFHLQEPSALTGLGLYAAIENDTASLRLDIRAAAKPQPKEKGK